MGKELLIILANPGPENPEEFSETTGAAYIIEAAMSDDIVTFSC